MSMTKAIIAFIIFFVITHAAIMMWRELTKQEKWSTIKTIAYSLGISVIVVGFLFSIVIIF